MAHRLPCYNATAAISDFLARFKETDVAVPAATASAPLVTNAVSAGLDKGMVAAPHRRRLHLEYYSFLDQDSGSVVGREDPSLADFVGGFTPA